MDIRGLQSAAVRSLKRRGFHDNLPARANNPLLCEQWLRFTEEIGELSRAMRKPEESVADEMADVLIVLFQLAEVLGVDLETATVHKLEDDEARGYLHNGTPDVAPSWTRAKVVTFREECSQ